MDTLTNGILSSSTVFKVDIFELKIYTGVTDCSEVKLIQRVPSAHTLFLTFTSRKPILYLANLL